jgi:MFS family permease
VTTPGIRSRRIHPAWIVAGVAFLALVGAAGFRSAPSALLLPLEAEFGWTRSELSVAIGINILLYGLTAPFAAALMERFGVRRVTSIALLAIAAGAGLSVLVTESWMLLLTWGVLIGLGTGSMALVFAAIIADRWFVKNRGLVVGILTAGSATGQLIFLPIVAGIAADTSWRLASLLIAGIALAVVPIVAVFLRNSPADLNVTPFGSPADAVPTHPERSPINPALRALQVLGRAAKVRTFWALVAGFAICGATTNGLIGTHFIPAAHDHGMAEVAAAGLLGRGALRRRRHDRLGLADGPGEPPHLARRLLRWPGRVAAASAIPTVGDGAASDHLVRRHLRARLGRDGPADRGALPGGVRHRRVGRVWLGVRRAPGRRGRGRDRRRGAEGHRG